MSRSANRESYRRKAEARVDEQRARLDKAKARLKKHAAEGSIEVQKQIEALEKKLGDASKRLAKLADAGEDAWDEVRGGFEKQWDELSSSLKGFFSRLSD